jgi:hypothetical protein
MLGLPGGWGGRERILDPEGRGVCMPRPGCQDSLDERETSMGGGSCHASWAERPPVQPSLAREQRERPKDLRLHPLIFPSPQPQA